MNEKTSQDIHSPKVRRKQASIERTGALVVQPQPICQLNLLRRAKGVVPAQKTTQLNVQKVAADLLHLCSNKDKI